MKSQFSTDPAPIAQSPLDMIRPVLWMAAAAFAAGFGGYLMLGLKAAHPAAPF